MPKMTVSHGDRNCNPLNIIKSNDKRIGEIESYNSRFGKYITHCFGFRAVYICLKHYHVDGCTTLSLLIGKWALETENKTSEYIHFVSKYSGIYPSEVFSWNYTNVSNIIKYMSIYENGYCPDEMALNEAISKYFIPK